MRVIYILAVLLLFAVGYGMGSIHQINKTEEVIEDNNHYENACHAMNGDFRNGECFLNWEGV